MLYEVITGKLRVVDHYRALKDELGYRPSAVQAYLDGIDFSKVRKHATSWFNFLLSESDIPEDEIEVVTQYADFLLKGVETTTMTKSFKVILLQAFLELDGFRNPPSLASLSKQSYIVLKRHPDLFKKDLPERYHSEDGQSPEWLKYWKSNPIQFSTKNDKEKPDDYWFMVEDDQFKSSFHIVDVHIDILHRYVQELIDLRLMEYHDRSQSS